MVLGLDVLGAASDDLILDWEGRRLTLAGPLLPIKRALATVELPLVKCVPGVPCCSASFTNGAPHFSHTHAAHTYPIDTPHHNCDRVDSSSSSRPPTANKGAYNPPFGLPRQYGVSAVVGGNSEVSEVSILSYHTEQPPQPPQSEEQTFMHAYTHP